MSKFISCSQLISQRSRYSRLFAMVKDDKITSSLNTNLCYSNTELSSPE